jgi:hypothetical protein
VSRYKKRKQDERIHKMRPFPFSPLFPPPLLLSFHLPLVRLLLLGLCPHAPQVGVAAGHHQAHVAHAELVPWVLHPEQPPLMLDLRALRLRRERERGREVRRLDGTENAMLFLTLLLSHSSPPIILPNPSLSLPIRHTSRTKDIKSSWASVWLVGQAVKAHTKANCSHTAALGRARGPVGGPATRARARCKV